MNITLCILTLNELVCARTMVPHIPPAGPAAGYDRIVAVDGGSTDGTIEWFKSLQIPVLVQPQRGRGRAFLHAFDQITDTDAYLFFSPDGNEAIQDLPRFKPLLQAGADMVIASRMLPGAVNEEDGKPWRWRKWANRAFNLLANVTFRRTGPFITDSINGYRAVTRNAALRIKPDAPDFSIEYQMTIRALRARLRIVEFPTVEGPRLAGTTGCPSVITGLRFLKRFAIELGAAGKYG